ncbi:MAG: hypothetical protein HZB33_11070 [Nitrospirae bacterium]|nr:hypothetical protein [Nitrospirota bacterium]
MDNPKILDNSIPQFQLRTYLSDLLTSDKYTELSIATGYWDLPGMLELLPAFETFFGNSMFSEIRFRVKVAGAVTKDKAGRVTLLKVKTLELAAED